MAPAPSRLTLPIAVERAVVALLLALYWAMSVSAIHHKSATFDEPIHLRAGYMAWSAADYRLDPENGILPSRWGAIPLLFADARFPEAHGENNNFAEMLFRARMSMALIGAALGATIFLISKNIWGSAGGLVSLTLYVFSPAMLAQGCLVTSDVTAALFFTLATWTVWKLLHRISIATVLGAGLSLSGLALSKMSAGVFVMIAAAMIAVRLAAGRPLEIANRFSITRRGRQAALILGSLIACGLLVWPAMWAAYSFRYSMVNPEYHPVAVENRWASVLADASPIVKTMPTLRSLRVLPEGYLFGLAYTLHHSGARTSYLFGEVSTAGFLHFFPAVVLIKTPLPFLALLALALIIIGKSCWRKVGESDVKYYDLLPLVILCAGYAGVAIASRFNVGERHLLPAYPPLFVLAGASAAWWQAGHGWRRLTVALLLGWCVVESLIVRPHYLAYFNELVGGPKNGYRHLVDSSLDWGQDLPALRDWLEQHQRNQPDGAYVAYFGADSLSDYGIRATRLGRDRTMRLPPLTGGVYCVSATSLACTFLPVVGKWNRAREAEYQALSRDFAAGLPAPGNAEVEQRVTRFAELREARLWAFLRHRKPDEEIAYSILVFWLTDKDVEGALNGPPAELDGR